MRCLSCSAGAGRPGGGDRGQAERSGERGRSDPDDAVRDQSQRREVGGSSELTQSVPHFISVSVLRLSANLCPGTGTTSGRWWTGVAATAARTTRGHICITCWRPTSCWPESCSWSTTPPTTRASSAPCGTPWPATSWSCSRAACSGRDGTERDWSVRRHRQDLGPRWTQTPRPSRDAKSCKF